MKKLILSLALIASTFVFAQKSKTVRFAIFNDVIGTTKVIERSKEAIKSMKSYKAGETLPVDLKKYAFLADNGLTKVELQPGRIVGDLYPLQTFNKQYNLDPNTPVVIDGYTFDAGFTIYSDIVSKAEVLEKDGRKYLSVETFK